MPGREREFVGRQHLRPAVRLDLTWPLPLAQMFERLEDEDSADRRGSGRPNGGKPLRTAVKQQHDAKSVPQPAVAHACRGNHPVANPSRRAPAVHPLHDAKVASLDKSPDTARDGHRVTSRLDQKRLQDFSWPVWTPGSCPMALADV